MSRRTAIPLLTERLSQPHAAHNASVIAFARTLSAILAGCIAGVLGLTGALGFVFFALSVLLNAAFIAYIHNLNIKPFFQSPSSLLLDGLMSGLMSYVLFWTVCYDIVYIY